MGNRNLQHRAWIYTQAGEADSAVALLDHLFSIPSEGITVPRMRVDPRWQPLRDYPRFQALLEKHEQPGPH